MTKRRPPRTRRAAPARSAGAPAPLPDYGGLVTGLSDLLDSALRKSARAVNSILTTTYWEIGRRIVEYEQAGKARAEYGSALLTRLSRDLCAAFGRGFSLRNLKNMRALYTGWEIRQTPCGESEVRAIRQTPSAELGEAQPADICGDADPSPIRQGRLRPGDPWISEPTFPLSWSHYIQLMSVPNPNARAFYEAEAIRGGWSVRQLGRQIAAQVSERTSRSKQPEAMLAQARMSLAKNEVRPEDEVRLELGSDFHFRRPPEAHPRGRFVIPNRSRPLSPHSSLPRARGSQDRRLHPRRRGREVRDRRDPSAGVRVEVPYRPAG
jgi:hypothetical protein